MIYLEGAKGVLNGGEEINFSIMQFVEFHKALFKM